MKNKPKSPTLSVCITFQTEAEKQSFVNKAKATGRSVSGFLKFAGLKELTKLLLLLLSISSYSQDTICLPKETYNEIYKGLKAEEYYRQANSDCIEIANSLNVIIQQQNDSLQFRMYKLDEVNYELDYLNYQYQEAIKDRPAPWYKKWWVWAITGLLTGILIR